MDDYADVMISAKQILTLVFILSLLINSLMLIMQWYALAPTGSYRYLQFSTWLLIPLTLVMVIIPFLVLGLLLPYKRKRTLLTVSGCIIYVSTGFLFAKLTLVYRENIFTEFAERSHFLIAAIERFEREQGHAPAALQFLVPGYLPAVPGTDIGAYPDYRYETGNDIYQSYSRPWILYVAIPRSGSDKSDEKFIYLPSQDYLDKWQDRVIQRLGGWVFVREN